MKPKHLFSSAVFVLSLCGFFEGLAWADNVPATQPADSPAMKEVRQQLLDWDKQTGKMSLEEVRKTFHTENDREATYFDWVAHEAWEASKTELAVREKWGPEGDAKFLHVQGGTTVEDDQACDINVDGNHAIASWKIEGTTPLPMIKIDGHWLVDGHATFERLRKDDPNPETDKHDSAALMKQARQDIDSGKFDDVDSFIADFQKKATAAPEGGN